MLSGKFIAIQRLPQETRETSNQQLNFTLKATRKRTTTTTTNPVSRRKDIIKFRAEINGKKKKKETIAKINKTKCWFFEKIK